MLDKHQTLVKFEDKRQMWRGQNLDFEDKDWTKLGQEQNMDKMW